MIGHSSPLAKTAFLDTNALVRLFAYWQVCRTADTRLDAVADLADLKAKLGGRVRLPSALTSADYEPVSTGMRCFLNLLGGAHEYVTRTSRLCVSELHHVVTTGLALERLARRRVPYSLRVKRPQIIYRKALAASDYSQIADGISEFFEALRLDYGVDIVQVEDAAAGPIAPYEDVLSVAQEIWTRILIEVMDAYVFAAAVVTLADVFMTADAPLRDALQRFTSPDPDWQSATRSFRRALGMRQSDRLPLVMAPTSSLP